MLKIYISILTVSISLNSCNNEDKRVLLRKNSLNNIETIDYSKSRKYGNFLNAVMRNNDLEIHYNLYITDSGRILHVIKQDQKSYDNKEETLDSYRSLQLLVTDTSNQDPNFFGSPINGYYSDPFLVNNVIFKQTTKKNVTPLSKEEKKLFSVIDSLTKRKNIKYNLFDTSKVLGWFKYVF